MSPDEQLHALGSVSVVRQRFEKLHSATLSNSKAFEIVASYRQARNYRSAADAADLSIRPVLVYYGILSLSVGTILLLSKEARQSSLAPAHGLSITNQNDCLSGDRPDIRNVQVATGEKGTFAKLLAVTKNVELLRTRMSCVSGSVTNYTPPPGSKIFLHDVLSRMPEFESYISNYTDAPIVPFHLKKNGDDVVYSVSYSRPHHSWEFVADILSETDYRVVETTPKRADIAIDGERLYFEIKDRIEGPFSIGDMFMVQRMPGNIELNKICQAFVVSYVLGMVCRYYAKFWIGFNQNKYEDCYLPAVQKAMEFCNGNLLTYFMDAISIDSAKYYSRSSIVSLPAD